LNQSANSATYQFTPENEKPTCRITSGGGLVLLSAYLGVLESQPAFARRDENAAATTKLRVRRRLDDR